MKTPKILMIALLMFVGSLANAQSSKEIEKEAKEKTKQLVQMLDLTEDQEVMVYRQVYTLESQIVRFNALEEKTDKAVATMDQQKEYYKAEVYKRLTDAQRESFDAAWAKTMK